MHCNLFKKASIIKSGKVYTQKHYDKDVKPIMDYKLARCNVYIYPIITEIELIQHVIHLFLYYHQPIATALLDGYVGAQ